MTDGFPCIDGKKDIYTARIDLKDLKVRKAEVISSLGYTNGILPAHFEKMIDAILSQLSNYCAPLAGYRILDVQKSENRHDGVMIGGSFFAVQKIVASHLRKSEKVLLFVCSIGSGMETWAKKLSTEGDTTLSYLVDTVASITVEQVADVLHDHIGKHMLARGLKISNRYSPGYCDWLVSEQHLLFSFLPAHFCGITLTESALMIPIKSVSGIIGAGAAVKRVDYMCSTCGMKDCTYRAYRRAKTKRAGRKV
jgi:Vitamin B12 dependent methionine synthase, activation domain